MRDANELMKKILAELSVKKGVGDGSKPLLSRASQLLAENGGPPEGGKAMAMKSESRPGLFSPDELPKIPPPSAPKAPVSVDAPLEATEADWDMSTHFVNTSLRLAGVNVPAEDEVSFIANSSWFPTFENLGEQQLRWYVYWRERWRSGRCGASGATPANEKDILLLAAELVNCSYVRKPSDSYRLLERLVSDFAPVSKNISNYGELWLGDMAWELGLADEAEAHYDRLPQSYGFLSRAVREHKGLEWEPLIFISAYGPSAYFEKRRNELVALFARALEGADAFVSSDGSGHGLLRLLNKGRSIRTSRYAHKPYWALPVHRRLWGEKLWCTVMQNCDRLLQQMGDFLKAVENLHRQCLGEKRLLKVELGELPPSVNGYLSVLGGQLAEELKDRSATERSAAGKRKSGKGKGGSRDRRNSDPDETPAVVLDPALAKQLRDDSREVTEIIMASLEGSSDSDPGGTDASGPEVAATPASDGASMGSSESSPRNIEDIFPGAASALSDDACDGFAVSLNGLERSFLVALCGCGETLSIRRCREWAAEHGKMLASLIDGINEKALDTVGEPVLDESDAEIALSDQYREALRKSLEK